MLSSLGYQGVMELRLTVPHVGVASGERDSLDKEWEFRSW